MFFGSEAESIYNAWSTRSSRGAVTPEARALGRFDDFRKTGFNLITEKLVAYQGSKGSRKMAEQAWKLIDKFKRRQDQTVAQEVLKVLQGNVNLKGALSEYPASMFPNLTDEAQETAKSLDLQNLRFPKTGKVIRVGKMLGQGGMGGAVYLGEDQFGERYAVKHFQDEGYAIRGFGENTPKGQLNRTMHHLGKYFEASVTTTCEDTLAVGRDQFLLLRLGEGRVDYGTLRMSDVISVFQDLDKVYQFSKNYMSVDVAQDVSVLHMDVHGENMMRFDGKLRFIDFGTAMIFDAKPAGTKNWSNTTLSDYNPANSNLYLQNQDMPKREYHDPKTKSWRTYIQNWQKAYREAPEVQVCRSCNRQYPAGLTISECLKCGSKKIETAPLRRSDIQALANVKGVSPGTIGDNPYAHGSVTTVTAQQYGCIVLTAVLIKEVWAATEGGRDLGMGGQRAPLILNVEAYGKARAGLHTFKAAAPGSGSLIDLLLLWYDEMMRRLFDGETFTARDAVTFLGGERFTPASRGRRHSIAV